MNITPKPNFIQVFSGECWLKDNKVTYLTDEKIGDEAYVIEIKEGETLITSKTEKGRYYAGITLAQLEEAGKTPLCKIVDEPAYPYRGFMIDSARHMQSIDEIKAYITAAARYKLNVFHWHLCDDQGFRIESERYPKLNEVGSYRSCHGFGSENMSRYGGYYTKAEIREIIAFCKEKFIEVIPEVDIPGHTKAILATFPELSCRGEAVEVETVGGIFKDIMCAGKEETFDFCFGLLDEIIELFPSEYIHIGGDEAPKARWCECKKCQKRIKEEKLENEEQLQAYFTKRVVAHLKEKGKKAICWNESLNSGFIGKEDTIISNWMDRKKLCADFANKGGKVIAEDFYHYYLDYEYGMTPLKKTYGYNPAFEGLTSEGEKNIIGVETPIWTEYVEDFDRMSYMCFPRLIAVAESGWTRNSEKNYKDFKVRVSNQKEFLLSLGIKQADEKCWDPGVMTRVKITVGRFLKSINRNSINATLFPNRNED
ncbi:MAG: beta-N-acetylhexosaminidase [Clostridia bacterium]|nr:beta-N-acetylhexosaminidase [Clostridia bacterium]